MPLVTVTMMEGRPLEFKKAMLDEIHASLVSAFKIPDDDRNQRLIEIKRENFEHPPVKTENSITIEMTIFPGRSLKAKKGLYSELNSRLQKIGIQPFDIMIILHEPPLDNWGIRGGYPASEVDIGFKIKV